MTEPNRQSGENEERIIEIEIERLRPFKEHPFQVKDDKEGRQVHRTSERKRSAGCKNRESWKRTAGSETENKEARYGTLIKNNHLVN